MKRKEMKEKGNYGANRLFSSPPVAAKVSQSQVSKTKQKGGGLIARFEKRWVP